MLIAPGIVGPAILSVYRFERYNAGNEVIFKIAANGLKNMCHASPLSRPRMLLMRCLPANVFGIRRPMKLFLYYWMMASILLPFARTTALLKYWICCIIGAIAGSQKADKTSRTEGNGFKSGVYVGYHVYAANRQRFVFLYLCHHGYLW